MSNYIEEYCDSIAKEFGIDSNELKIHLNQKYISKGKEVKIITIRHIAEKISKKKGK